MFLIHVVFAQTFSDLARFGRGSLCQLLKRAICHSPLRLLAVKEVVTIAHDGRPTLELCNEALSFEGIFSGDINFFDAVILS